ncbi:ubiquitin-protein ligase [Phaffia rhodozyma]|uniref:Ubiquitin-protein ligase n=1 Tax=Phaffia rhodozyma TaxID=264483 RepID=A0A0F7SYC4_PHARH|nr:ubiquitin-protein ligase [Phaffia rhodozyma]
MLSFQSTQFFALGQNHLNGPSVASAISGKPAVRQVYLVAPATPQPTPQLILHSVSVILSPQPFSPTDPSVPCTEHPPLSSALSRLPRSLQSIYALSSQLAKDAENVRTIVDKVQLELEKSASDIAKTLVHTAREQGLAGRGLSWLEQIERAWSWWKARIDVLSLMLSPLARSIRHSHPEIKSIRDLAQTTFHQLVFLNQSLQATSLASLTLWIEQDRQAGPLDSRALVASLTPLHFLIHPTIYALTQAHYQSLHNKLFQASVPVLDFLTQTFRSVHSESTLYQILSLSQEQASELERVVLDEMIGQNGIAEQTVERCLAEWIIIRPFEVILDEKDAAGTGTVRWGEGQVEEEGLEILSSLTRKVGKESTLRTAIGKWVALMVAELIKDASKDSTTITTLLTARALLERLVSQSLAIRVPSCPSPLNPTENPIRTEEQAVLLERDKSLADSVRSGFERGLQTRGARGAELIAKAMDNLLRSRSTSSDELEKDLDDLLDLVRSVRDKDVFKAFYVNALAKRLLLGKSASDDAELGMISRLKKELGEDFITGDGMLADLNLSTELMKSYRIKHDPVDDSDLSVAVLSSANWPTYPAVTEAWKAFVLPSFLAHPLESFKQFYTQSHQSRLLDYRYQLFSMTLKASFPSGTKELNVSLFQGLVLLAFNQVDITPDGHSKLSWEEIMEKTGIEEPELSRTLQSLACGRVRVLTKHPTGKDVLRTDSFTFNEKFTHPRVKIKINQVQQNQTVEEDVQTENRVMHDRSHLLDAAIVRIMKSKKVCTWVELTNLCVDAVRNKFPPEPKAIKHQIESLLEREYLARDDDDPMRVLRYLA